MKQKIIVFSLVFSGLCCSLNCAAQKDTLRWFVGKWKDKKTFIADSSLYGGIGGTLTIDADGNTTINTPENKKWNDLVDVQAKETERTEDEIKNMIHSNEGLLQYGLGRECVNELEKVKEEMKEYKAVPTKEETEKLNLQFKKDLNNWCMHAKADYTEVMNFYQLHRKIRNEHFILPAPPVADYNCWGCDKKKRAAYDTSVENYKAAFFKEEAGLITKALSICRNLQLLGVNNTYANAGDDIGQEIDKVFHHDRNDPSKNGPCYGLSESDLWEAVHYLVQRGLDKANQLLKENKKNYNVFKPVIKVNLSAYREAQLMGINAEADFATFGDMIKHFYDQQRNKLLQEKDYSQIANIPFLVGILKEYTLTTAGGLSGPAQRAMDDDCLKEIHKLYDFCHFKLTVDMDIKTGTGKAYTLVHLKGTAKVICETDSVHCVKFLLAKEENAYLKMDIVANEFIAPGPHPIYIDAKQAETPMPVIDIHFCTQGNDSIYLNRFIPVGHARGLWQVPGGPNAPMWINGVDNYFIDQQQQAAGAEAIAMDYKNNPQKLAAMTQNVEAMKQKLEEMKRSKLPPAQMAAEIKKMMTQNEQFTQVPIVQVAQLKFPVKLQTGSEVLFKETYDAKKIDPVQANTIVYGYLNIMLEHVPLGSDN